jgi:hypothetical protein
VTRGGRRRRSATAKALASGRSASGLGLDACRQDKSISTI